MWPLFVIVARVPSFSLRLPLRRYSIRVECLSSTAPESHRISRDHSPCKPSLEQRETSQPTVNTNQLIMTQQPSQSSHPPSPKTPPPSFHPTASSSHYTTPQGQSLQALACVSSSTPNDLAPTSPRQPGQCESNLAVGRKSAATCLPC